MKQFLENENAFITVPDTEKNGDLHLFTDEEAQALFEDCRRDGKAIRGKYRTETIDGEEAQVFDGVELFSVFTPEEITQRTKQIQIAELKAWFDTEYRYLAEKYLRFIRLNITYNDKTGAELLNELDVIAEEKRAQINTLEG